MPIANRRYKVTYKNGQFKYIMAPNEREARIEAAKDRAIQNKYNESHGESKMSPVDSVDREP